MKGGGGREKEEGEGKGGGGREEGEGRRRKGGGGSEGEGGRGKGGGGREEEEGRRRKGGGGREVEGRRRKGGGGREEVEHRYFSPLQGESCWFVISCQHEDFSPLHRILLAPPLVVVSTRPLSTAQNPTGSSSCGGQHETSFHCTESCWFLISCGWQQGSPAILSCGGQHEDFTAQNPAGLSSHGPLSHPSWLG
ncbi:hypothetical protein ACOMHN_038580 [Nucella lapillus]